MFELIALALFQIYSLTGNPTVTTNGGSGGWGNDVTAPTVKTNGGSGGWGNDVTAPTVTTYGGSGGWGND